MAFAEIMAKGKFVPLASGKIVEGGWGGLLQHGYPSGKVDALHNLSISANVRIRKYLANMYFNTYVQILITRNINVL